MMRRVLFILAALATSTWAQTPSPSASGTPSPSPSVSPSQQPLWRCDLPGGTYEVAIRSMVSVSLHEYIVDAVARVVEVNVDTQGNTAVRFYFIEPKTPKAPAGVGQSTIDKISDLAKEAANRGGPDDMWKRVIKTYPATTHTHTVEYRVKSEDEVRQIFESAEGSFRSGQSATFQLAGQ